MSLISEVDRYVRLKRSLGYKSVDNERMLRSYARFATDHDDELICAATAPASCITFLSEQAFAP